MSEYMAPPTPRASESSSIRSRSMTRSRRSGRSLQRCLHTSVAFAMICLARASARRNIPRHAPSGPWKAPNYTLADSRPEVLCPASSSVRQQIARPTSPCLKAPNRPSCRKIPCRPTHGGRVDKRSKKYSLATQRAPAPLLSWGRGMVSWLAIRSTSKIRAGAVFASSHHPRSSNGSQPIGRAAVPSTRWFQQLSGRRRI